VAFRQALHAKLAERIASDARSESNATTKERNIVRKDCRRTAEGKRKIAGQVLSLGFKHWRKAIKDQITIQFAHDADVKTLQ